MSYYLLLAVATVIYLVLRKIVNRNDYKNSVKYVEEIRDESGSIRGIIESLSWPCIRISIKATSAEEIEMKKDIKIDGTEILHAEKVDDNRFLFVAVRAVTDNSLGSNIIQAGFDNAPISNLIGYNAKKNKELIQFRYLFEFNYEDKFVKIYSEYFDDTSSKNLIKSTAITIFDQVFVDKALNKQE